MSDSTRTPSGSSTYPTTYRLNPSGERSPLYGSGGANSCVVNVKSFPSVDNSTGSMSSVPSNSSGLSAGNLTTPVDRRLEPNSTARSPSIRNNPSAISVVISIHLDYHRRTHASAGAHRQHADAATAAAQFVNRRRDHPGSRRGDRVAQADARAVHVDDLLVEAELTRTGDGLGGERLVDLE